MVTNYSSKTIHFLALALTLILVPNCMHSFRISPERSINQALDVIEDVDRQFGSAFEIMANAPESRKESELKSHVIMVMQERGQHAKGYFDIFFDIDHDYELFPFVHYQKMIDVYVNHLIAAQKNLVACKYREQTGPRLRVRIDELEEEISIFLYQLKSIRKFVVSHEQYWQEKEKLEKREHDRRELLLKQERNAIEQEKLSLERERQKSKRKREEATYNHYDVTLIHYYD